MTERGLEPVFSSPDEFAEYERIARVKGFLMVSASPLTRSSYHADADFARLREAAPSLQTLIVTDRGACQADALRYSDLTTRPAPAAPESSVAGSVGPEPHPGDDRAGGVAERQRLAGRAAWQPLDAARVAAALLWTSIAGLGHLAEDRPFRQESG